MSTAAGRSPDWLSPGSPSRSPGHCSRQAGRPARAPSRPCAPSDAPRRIAEPARPGGCRTAGCDPGGPGGAGLVSVPRARGSRGPLADVGCQRLLVGRAAGRARRGALRSRGAVQLHLPAVRRAGQLHAAPGRSEPDTGAITRRLRAAAVAAGTFAATITAGAVLLPADRKSVV